VCVADVEPGSQAAAAGLKAGQQVATINDHPVRTPGEALALLLQAGHGGATLAIVTREPESRHRWIAAGPLPRSLPGHPAQVYSTINALVLCLLLVAYDPFRRRDGELTALLLTLYPVTRFLLEIIRTDESPVFGTQMSISQNVSLMFLAAMAALWIYILTRPRGVEFGYPLRMTK